MTRALLGALAIATTTAGALLVPSPLVVGAR